MSRYHHPLVGLAGLATGAAVLTAAFTTPNTAAYFVDTETISVSARAGTWDVDGRECDDDERPAAKLCVPTVDDQADKGDDKSTDGDTAEPRATNPDGVQTPQAEPVPAPETAESDPESDHAPDPRTDPKPEPTSEPTPEPSALPKPTASAEAEVTAQEPAGKSAAPAQRSAGARTTAPPAASATASASATLTEATD